MSCTIFHTDEGATEPENFSFPVYFWNVAHQNSVIESEIACSSLIGGNVRFATGLITEAAKRTSRTTRKQAHSHA